MVSNYNAAPYGVKNLLQIIGREIKMSGFQWSNKALQEKYAEAFFRDFPKLVASGQIKYKEDRSYGLQSVGQAILDVQKGNNFGKKIIILSEPPSKA